MAGKLLRHREDQSGYIVSLFLFLDSLVLRETSVLIAVTRLREKREVTSYPI